MKMGNFRGLGGIFVLAAVVVIGLMAGCKDPLSSEDIETIGNTSKFVAVDFISDVPETGTVGSLSLYGMVKPSNATNQAITWSVVSAGTTGASISGSTLTTQADGTVTVRATIANGTAQGINYTQDFPISIRPAGGSSFDITYYVEQTGGINGEIDSTGIVFTFSESVDSLCLTAAVITVSGAAEKDAEAELTGEGIYWTLAPITVNNAGLATVSIDKSGIESSVKDVIIYQEGELVPEYWSITWYLNGGTEGIDAQHPTLIEKNTVLDRPSPDPTRADYTFGGWYADYYLTQAYDFANAVTGDLYLYAKWVEEGTSITIAMWDSYGDGWNNAALRINVNGTNRATNATLANGSQGYYTFAVNPNYVVQIYWVSGGQYDRECAFAVYYSDDPPSPMFNPSTGTTDTDRVLISKLYNKPSGAVGNGTLMGSFIVGGYTVTFDSNGGSIVPSQPVESGGMITEPTPPTRTDNTFIGWYRDNTTFQNQWNFATDIVTSNLTLYAKWESQPLSPDSTLARKLQWVKNNAQSNSTYTLEVNADETMSPQTLSYDNLNNITINLISSEGEREISLSRYNTGSLFTVGIGVTLILDNNITLKGHGDNSVSLVKVDGALKMKTGSKITGNEAYAYSDSSNRINAYAYGGGVYVAASGTFTMDGGEISDNRARVMRAPTPGLYIGVNDIYAYGGGVYVDNNGSFIINNGKITGNRATSVSYNSSNEVYARGGGVCVVTGGNFTMNGGEISDNTAFAYYEVESSLKAYAYGGGVYVDKNVSFIMNNGKITGNTVDGTPRSSNVFYTKTGGGGVYVSDYGTFTMSRGEISGNTSSSAHSTYGGGVYMSNYGTFTMSGGEIADNSSTSTRHNNNYPTYSSYGGGVYVSDNVTFTMSGGNITGNNASSNFNSDNSYGGGVYMKGRFTIGGTAQIYGNTRNASRSTNSNVYLDNQYITLGSGSIAPAYGMNVYVQTTAANGVIVQSGADANAAQYFHSDVDNNEVICQGTQLVTGNFSLIIWHFNDGTAGTGAQYPPHIEKGTVLAKPSPDPSKANNIFGGWYSDSALTQPYNFANPVTANLNLYAKWEVIEYRSITWNFNGGTAGTGAQHPAQILKGTVLAKPSPNPSKADYIFDGWYTDSNLTQAYNFANPVTVNLSLYAKWIIEYYPITWNFNGGTAGTGAQHPAQILNGTVLTKPSPNPSKADYVFDGWYTDSNLTQAYTFANRVTANLNLYAKWREYTLTEKLARVLNANNVEDGQTYTIEVTANEAINPHTLSYSNRNNITIILSGSGGEKIISLSQNGSLFTVSNSVTLVLENNITLQGRSNNTSLVSVNGGKLIMNTGAKITGNTSSGDGGGVYVGSGIFTMSGGEISGNAISGNSYTSLGGGVLVSGSATFTMTGGKISGNTSSCPYTNYGGGVCVSGSATFTMTGGEISGNTNSGSYTSSGGGVYVSYSATFTKSGGTIYGYDANDTINSNVVDSGYGTIRDNRGHAVYVDSSPEKRRETTAGPTDNLDSSKSGGWEN